MLPKEKDIRTWLKFSTLCQKTKHLSLAQQILQTLIESEEEISVKQQQQQQNNGGGAGGFNATAAAANINSSRDLELCKYVYLKSLYANGHSKEAFDKLSMFVNSNLREQLTQIQRYQQFQQQQQYAMQGAAAIAGGPMIG